MIYTFNYHQFEVKHSERGYRAKSVTYPYRWLSRYCRTLDRAIEAAKRKLASQSLNRMDE